MVGAIVGQRVSVSKGAADHRSVLARHRGEAGDVELAISSRHRLRRKCAIADDECQRGAERYAVEAVEHNRTHAVRGGDREAVTVGHAVGRRVRPGGFADARGQIVFIDAKFRALGIKPTDRHAVVGAVDRDRQRRGRSIAIAVGDRISESFGQRLACRQPLHRLRLIVQHISVAAVAVERQRAIGGRETFADRAPRHSGDSRAIGTLNILRAVGGIGVRAACAGQYIAIGGRRIVAVAVVFGYAVGIIRRRRNVVDDADVEARITGRSIAVGDDYRKAVGDIVLTLRRVRQRVVRKDIFIGEGSANHRSVGTDNRRKAGDVDDPERAIGSACREDAIRHDLRAADRHIAEPVGGRHGEGSRLGQRRRIGRRTVDQIILVDDDLAAFDVQAVDRHAVVGAVDRDRQRCRCGVAVAIGERICEDFGQRLASREALHRLRVIIQRIGVAAISVQRQRAIGGSKSLADRTASHCCNSRAIGALDVGRPVGCIGIAATRSRQNIAVGDQGSGPPLALSIADLRPNGAHAVDIVDRRRGVIDNADVQYSAGAIAIAVGHNEVEGHNGPIGIERVVGQRIGINDGSVAGAEPLPSNVEPGASPLRDANCDSSTMFWARIDVITVELSAIAIVSVAVDVSPSPSVSR